ncbi:putative membrane protein [Candidatus Burkholderia verschuerenii]|uniref:Putative membrane protein n=1 Tax=Candidatus Burkholderia verschuerenii TaxID=242163 RepID=A0A0L0MG47_9BURK|nr:MFS transporter [Candidatus Burkholderia verschuerenii]KND61281.1 putative membrane protein [Candidatus Burkholderia verschuerenii]
MNRLPDRLPAARFSTRLAFLVAGFGIACWAPLVPFAKQRLGVDDGVLGLLLLCIGVGSVIAMVLTGALTARYGSKPVIVAGGAGLAVVLPTLAIVDTAPELGIALTLFGACLGSLDVAMNIHAVDVERAEGRPLMSGFHALFSVGGFLGSTMMTFLLSSHIGTVVSTLPCALLMLVAIAVVRPGFIVSAHASDAPLFALPRGIVLLICALAAIAFLVEGALLDWSALLITGAGLVSPAQGGIGYMAFSIAMTAGRFGGDALTLRIGDRAMMFWGGVIAVAGLPVLLIASNAALAMSGFVLIGLGASNVVPVLFRRAGSQTAMPSTAAVAAMTTTGYAGNLAGPAIVGFVAKATGLPTAFFILTALMCLVPACAHLVTNRRA